MQIPFYYHHVALQRYIQRKTTHHGDEYYHCMLHICTMVSRRGDWIDSRVTHVVTTTVRTHLRHVHTHIFLSVLLLNSLLPAGTAAKQIDAVGKKKNSYI